MAGYICLRLLPYAHAHEQHINVLKNFVYVYYGYRKRFKVSVSLNQDAITSFDSTSDPEPQNLTQVSCVGISV